jgi:hypothetical protein
MAGPWGVLSVGPTAATTGVRDIEGGPLGVLSAGPAAATTRVGDIDGGPLGVLLAGSAAATTKVGDVDGGPLGGAVGRSGSGHHRSWRCRWWALWHPWRYEVNSAKKDVGSNK